MAKRVPNEIFSFEGDTFLCVESPKHGRFLALIDSEHAERIGKHIWCLATSNRCLSRDSFYFQTHIRNADGSRGALSLHRLVMNVPNSNEVDHANHNYLDLRQSELRTATRAENQRNQLKTHGVSKYKGVYLNKREVKWVGQIRCDGKRIHLGCFPFTEQGEIDAAKAYDRKAIELFSDFARLNFKPTP